MQPIDLGYGFPDGNYFFTLWIVQSLESPNSATVINRQWSDADDNSRRPVRCDRRGAAGEAGQSDLHHSDKAGGEPRHTDVCRAALQGRLSDPPACLSGHCRDRRSAKNGTLLGEPRAVHDRRGGKAMMHLGEDAEGGDDLS